MPSMCRSSVPLPLLFLLSSNEKCLSFLFWQFPRRHPGGDRLNVQPRPSTVNPKLHPHPNQNKLHPTPPRPQTPKQPQTPIAPQTPGPNLNPKLCKSRASWFSRPWLRAPNGARVRKPPQGKEVPESLGRQRLTGFENVWN